MATPEQVVRVARVCHEVNRIYCESIGDNSQPVWEEAPEWQKTSAMTGVIYLTENPGASPENSHESWLAEKIRTGWRYGPEKDAEQKTHPCMVPYEDLPEDQRRKDALFHSIVRGILS